MKDPQVGAFGALAVVAVLLCKWVALTRLAEFGMLIWIVTAYVVSRTMMVDLAVRLPYARKEGTGASFVKNASPWHLLASTILGLALVLLVCGPYGAACFALGWIVSAVFGVWCSRQLGGVTGDLLGACSEMVETAILIVCAALGKRLIAFTGWKVLLP